MNGSPVEKRHAFPLNGGKEIGYTGHSSYRHLEVIAPAAGVNIHRNQARVTGNLTKDMQIHHNSSL
jgi:hypothetical protein